MKIIVEKRQEKWAGMQIITNTCDARFILNKRLIIYFFTKMCWNVQLFKNKMWRDMFDRYVEKRPELRKIKCVLLKHISTNIFDHLNYLLQV